MSIPLAYKSKRPGYSSAKNALKILYPIASGQLSKGNKLSARLLEDFGIPSSETYPAMIAYRHLQLVDRQDRVTEKFVLLAHATGGDYRAQLEDILRHAYPDVFERIDDLAHATRQELKNAFRDCKYEPVKMQSKMVSLFYGLCCSAGIILDESVTTQESSEQMTDVLSSEPPLNDVPLNLEEYELMAELPQSLKTNGVHYANSDDSLIEDLLTTFEQLHQDRKSANWSETDRPRWVKFLRYTNLLLGKALELSKGTE